ncbi:MAG TPA: aromatic ring-hydroxylating dioxygenase subunit alpha [Thermoleophilaceae bacterium]|nr:aromatic ring-hydroxylating dioxygenase subunit alpha [Thermoleophilaceae bacterium]
MDRTLVESRVETLPYSWYVDPAVAAAEHDRIFLRSWQYAGHLGELAGPGSLFPTQVGGLPVIVALDREGELRGHLNVCRHRGTILVSEPQTRGTIQCPYHAWTYGLDGALRAAPRSKDEPDFETDGLGLVPVQVDTWGPFVFVNPDPEAPPLAEALGDLPAVVAENGLDVSALRFHHRTTYGINANWKIAIENYLECYHCQLNHPDLMHVIDEQAQRHESAGLRLSQFPPLHPDVEAGRAPYDARGGPPTAQYHILFPAMKFNVNPGRPNLSIGPMWPVATDRTSAWLDYFFAEGTDGAWVEQMLEFDNQVGAEDIALVEAVQRGAGSGALPHGRLLTRTEVLIGAFQDLVRERVEPGLDG